MLDTVMKDKRNRRNMAITEQHVVVLSVPDGINLAKRQTPEAPQP